MIIYYLFPFLSMFLSFFTSKSGKKIIYYFLLFFTILLTGLRWEIGTDWDAYYLWFIDRNIFILNSNFNYFELFKFFPNYTAVLLFISLLFYSGSAVYFKKSLPKYYIIAFVLYYFTTIGALGANRQMLSVGLIFFGYLSKNKYTKYLVYFVSIIFHESAILAFPLFLSDRLLKKILNYSIPILLCALLFIFFKEINLLEKILNFSLKYDLTKLIGYSTRMSDGLTETPGIFGSIKRIFFLIIFYLNRNILDQKKYILYIFITILYFMFKDLIPVVVNRGVAFLAFIEIELLIASFLNQKFKKFREFAVFLILAYATLVFYKSISFFYDLFVPYNSIF